MTQRLVLCLFVIVAASAQEKDQYQSFTKSPTEHIINKLDHPFQVRSVSGAVTRQGGEQEPLGDVLVELNGPGDRQRIRRTKTNANGQFKISHVPAGTYTFKATLEGYQSVLGTIIVSTKACKDTNIKIAMLVGV